MSAELKAGFFVLAAVAALVAMTTRLTQNQYAFRGVKTYYAQVNDAAGLLSKTKVKMAGLDVGQLKDIELAGKRARITMEIAGDIELHKDAAVAIRSIGFLGDRYLELFPGTDTTPLMPEGGVLAESTTGGGLDALTTKTTEVVQNLKEITDVLKEALKGSENDEGDAGSRLDRILDNMEQFSAALASMDKLGDVADGLTDVTNNVREITDKVKNGEGTIGKLLTDTETIDKLNSALSGVNKFVTKADKIVVQVDARTSLLANTGGSKTMASLILQPTYDKYYLLGITSRPAGTTTVTKTSTTPDTPGGVTNTVETKENEVGGFSFNAQFAKRWGDFTARVGLFETTGGLGIDYGFLEDRLKVSSEIYRFKKGENPHLISSAEFSVFRPFFVWLGGDDLLKKDSRNFFIGGGIRFTDQDIKSLVVTTAASAR